MLKILQAGRALAAISVVAFHLSIMMGVERYGGQAVFQQYTSRGYLGVHFFFVLSGFVILLAHIRDIGHPQAWRKYAYRRFVRLLPVYWIYTGVFVALLAFGAGTEAKAPTGFLDLLSTWTLVKFSSAEPPLTVAWSLFHELAFYALFSLLILNRRAGIAAFAVWAVICMAFFHYHRETPFQVYTSAFNLFFLFGMAAYFLYKHARSGVPETIAGLVTLAIVAATLRAEHGGYIILLVAGFTLLLAGLAKLEERRVLKVPSVLVFLGDASYSIYLTHLAFAGGLLKGVVKADLLTRIGGPAVYLLVIAMTVGLGCLAYWFVERPLLRRLRSRRKSAPAEPVILASTHEPG